MGWESCRGETGEGDNIRNVKKYPIKKTYLERRKTRSNLKFYFKLWVHLRMHGTDPRKPGKCIGSPGSEKVPCNSEKPDLNAGSAFFTAALSLQLPTSSKNI